MNTFLAALAEAQENLSNSGEEMEIDDLLFELKIVVQHAFNAGTKMTLVAQKALRLCRPEQGLYVDNLPKKMKNMCGWHAFLQALVLNPHVREAWIGDLDWLIPHVDVNMFRDKKKLVARLVLELMAKFDVIEPLWIMQPVQGRSTIQMITEKQPKLYFVILDHNTKLLMFRSRGDDWEWRAGNTATIYLDYQMNFNDRNNVGHLRLVRNVRQYYNIHNNQPEYIWCDTCLNIHLLNFICENRRHGCPSCGREFMDEDALADHTTAVQYNQRPECPYCNILCYSEECLAMHRCCQSRYKFCDTCNKSLWNRAEAAHVCDQYMCKTCD